MTKQTVKAECGSCRGTGLYQGFAEPEGTAVICVECDGSGCSTISYTPFTKRKERTGVTKISQSRGSFVGSGVGARGGSISYAEFKAGKMPQVLDGKYNHP